MMLRSAIWFVTMACNFKCEYCWEVQAQRLGEFMPAKGRAWQDWLAVWERLAPAVLDVTGGEPFLLPGLVNLLASLPAATRIGLTTNLSHPLDEWIDRVPAQRFVNITCSFHPTQKMPSELFLGRVLRLAHRGYPVQVNMVAWPDTIWRARDWKGYFEHHGLKFHFDAYYELYDRSRLSRQEREIVELLVGDDRRPPSLAELPQVVCSGGASHLHVQPDGSAWRCLLEAKQKINPLGNVFATGFSLSSPVPCSQRRDCPHCDRDKVSVEPG